MALLAGCAARATHPTAETRPAQPGLSNFEERWLTACREGGLVGTCPATLRRPYVYIDVVSQQAYRRSSCSELDPSAGAAMHAALGRERARLRACFSERDEGAWVEIKLAAKPESESSPGLDARSVSCVREVLEHALAGIDTANADAIVVGWRQNADHPEERGSLSKQGIREAIHSRIAEVRACYERALVVWPRLEGKVATKFIIDTDGSVAMVGTAETTFRNPALECCINSAVLGWRFDKPEGGGIVIVTYPFILEQVD
jgi:hypothetical protein